ncbi:hypothetical protein ACF1BQ_007060 [Bradyrhizobium sp. RDT10]
MTLSFSLPSGFHAAVIGGVGDIGAAISNLFCDLGATVTATAVDEAAIARLAASLARRDHPPAARCDQ